MKSGKVLLLGYTFLTKRSYMRVPNNLINVGEQWTYFTKKKKNKI